MHWRRPETPKIYAREEGGHKDGGTRNGECDPHRFGFPARCVYYTPKYILENTVGKLVDGKSPKQVENLKILNPSCGSDSFLIEAYQKILEYHRN